MTSQAEHVSCSREDKESIKSFSVKHEPAAVIDKGVGDISEESYVGCERSLVRKLDLTLMPTIFVLYLLNYLDRNNIS